MSGSASTASVVEARSPLNSGVELPKCCGKGRKGVLFNGHTGSVWGGREVLGTAGGDGCAAV